MPTKKPRKSIQKSISVSPRMQALLDGAITVEDLDDEEILRGQLRSADGSFKGRPTNYLPRELAMAWQREGQKRHQVWVTETVPLAQKTIVKLMSSGMLSPADATKLKAAQWVLERFGGKTPDRVEVKAEVQTWEHVVEDILVDVEEDDDGFNLGA